MKRILRYAGGSLVIAVALTSFVLPGNKMPTASAVKLVAEQTNRGATSAATPPPPSLQSGVDQAEADTTQTGVQQGNGAAWATPEQSASPLPAPNPIPDQQPLPATDPTPSVSPIPSPSMPIYGCAPCGGGGGLRKPAIACPMYCLAEK